MGVSCNCALIVEQAALRARLLCLLAHNHLLWAWLASYLVTSIDKMTPQQWLHTYPRSCMRTRMRVLVVLEPNRDRGRLALYLYRVITLEKEKLCLT
jgi:hypothetical protein